MAKFTGKSQTLNFGGTAITCLTAVEFDSSVDAYLAECAGGTIKTTATGLETATMSADILISTDDNTLLAAIYPGSTGTLDWYPNSVATTGDLWFDIAVATVTSLSLSAPVNGYVAASVNFNLDDLTLTTVP